MTATQRVKTLPRYVKHPKLRNASIRAHHPRVICVEALARICNQMLPIVVIVRPRVPYHKTALHNAKQDRAASHALVAITRVEPLPNAYPILPSPRVARAARHARYPPTGMPPATEPTVGLPVTRDTSRWALNANHYGKMFPSVHPQA